MAVYDFPDGGRSDDIGGEPPDNSGMETRVAKIEAIIPHLATREDLVKVEGSLRADMARMEGNLRAEIHKAITDQTWKLITWVSTIAAGLVAAVYFIARNVH